MRRLPLILVVAALVVGLLYALTRDANDDDLDGQALARRQAQREVEQQGEDRVAQRDLNLLAKQGLGQEVPKHLVKRLGPGGRYWFVGNQRSELGVEVPFEPGRIPDPPPQVEPLGTNPGFLGANACRSCHKGKFDTFVHTAHHRTSRIANAETISGSFEQDENVMRTGDPNVYFTMLERDGKFYQRASFFDWNFEVPFDLIIGSSKMAES